MTDQAVMPVTTTLITLLMTLKYLRNRVVSSGLDWNLAEEIGQKRVEWPDSAR
jgi:hypothetical protein